MSILLIFPTECSPFWSCTLSSARGGVGGGWGLDCLRPHPTPECELRFCVRRAGDDRSLVNIKLQKMDIDCICQYIASMHRLLASVSDWYISNTNYYLLLFFSRWLLRTIVLILFASMNVSCHPTWSMHFMQCSITDPGYQAEQSGNEFGGPQLLLILLVWLLIAILLFGFR